MQRKKEIEYIYLMEKKSTLFRHSFIPTKFRSNKGYSSRSQVLLYTECQKVLSYNIVVAHCTSMAILVVEFQDHRYKIKLSSFAFVYGLFSLSPKSVVLTDNKRTVHLWAALHFYSIANFVASWLEWFQMI